MLLLTLTTWPPFVAGGILQFFFKHLRFGKNLWTLYTGCLGGDEQGRLRISGLQVNEEAPASLHSCRHACHLIFTIVLHCRKIAGMGGVRGLLLSCYYGTAGNVM